MEFDEIAWQQGWDQESISTVLRAFISSIGQDNSLNAYAQRVADEENDDNEYV